jgi:hypothetical protein
MVVYKVILIYPSIYLLEMTNLWEFLQNPMHTKSLKQDVVDLRSKHCTPYIDHLTYVMLEGWQTLKFSHQPHLHFPLVYYQHSHSFI